MASDQDEQRQFRRHAWRLACAFRTSEGDQRGFITNLSARGFFIQTRCRPGAGEEITATVENARSAPFELRGKVVRAQRSHRSMSALDQSGIGVQIDSAPEVYYQLVLEFEERT